MNLKMAACATAMATAASAFSRSSLAARHRTVSAMAPRLAPPHSSSCRGSTRLLSTAEATAAPAEAAAGYDDEGARKSLKSPFLVTMRDRGFLFQCTNLSELDQLMCDAADEGEAVSAYLGFDATADSLHADRADRGRNEQGGRSDGEGTSRVMLTDDIIKKNTDGISEVFQKFLSFGDAQPADAIMVNNDDWLGGLKYLQFLRDYGTHFTINRMMSFESVKQRLTREAPFSFLEFNYMILQAYDFLELNRRYDAKLQLGGSDQWGNMISGVELGRRVDSAQLYALTAPLITTSDGKKMGKTAGGAVWLNADKLSEYDYWQFWRNTSDEDVVRFLKLFTELPLDQIGEMESWKGTDINKAKIVLADEATALLHGRDCLASIHETIDGMFGDKKAGAAGGSTEGLNRVFVSQDDAAEGIKFIDLFVRLGLANSKKEARRLIQGGGARVGEEKITDENAVLNTEGFDDRGEATLRAGKKRAGVVEIE
ncbi:hypothetical protein ACHAXT_001848 [Thalassiosira profunda]